MRYFPAVPFVSRQTTAPTTLNGIRLDAGRLVLISIIGIHHHRHYWKEPHIFHTARTEFLEDTYDRRAFIPFITGARTCGGARLARLEITEGLKAFIRLYLVTRRGDDMTFDYGIALRPNCWNDVEIRRRERA